MKKTVFVTKELGVVEGTSKTTGNPYKIASYVVTLTGEESYQSMVIKVSDGIMKRIESFDLHAGRTYEVDVVFRANEYNGFWRNEITCTAAKEIVQEEDRQ